MSKQIDERVVSMQFDNKQFEANVKTSMSTIDKLKEKLHFKGATKGLENVGSAAKKVNMSSLSDSVETVRSRFSALEVMGVTALANITNSAVNAGKRIVSALTIDPVRSGFNEYELKMGSVQTIMASTGESLETVNKYLNELNQYSDDTIYSFQDMTQNIGKFTNAGVKLEDAVAAIKGISNEAAISGANANEASRAMYNFAQALSSGYVKLIDWKSIELANMATVGFKEQLIETAVAAGTLKKSSNGMYVTPDGNTMNATKNFNETLQDQWMTSEVLIETLKKYADKNTEIGKKANQAATEVKTFSQMMDTLKESAQSGWAQTWEIVFGDFNQGKTLWTTISNAVGKVLDKSSKARNELLSGALGGQGESAWAKLNEEIKSTGISTDDFGEKLKEVAKEEGYAVDDLIKKHGSLAKAFTKGEISTKVITKTLDELAKAEKGAGESTEDINKKLKTFQKVVNDVWRGDYSNGEARVKALTDAGYDYAKVQDLVNKTVDGHKLTIEDLSEAQLVQLGYTKEQIASIKKLAAEAKKTGTPINKLIEDLSKPSGRELLIDTFSNAAKGLSKTLGAVKDAWKSIFPPLTSDQLYNAIKMIHDLSEGLAINDKTAKKLERTFKGIFALLDIALTLISGPIKIALELVNAVLEEFDMDIFSVTAVIGDAIVKFRDWLDSIIDFSGVAKIIANAIRTVIRVVKSWINTFKEATGIGADFIKGIAVGFTDGLKSLATAAANIGKTIIDTVKDVLGIHSPATEGIEIGRNFILGIIKGIIDFGKMLFSVAGEVGLNIVRIISETIFHLGDALSDALSWIQANKLPLENLYFTIKDFISRIGDFLAAVIPSISSAIKGLVISIFDAIRKIDFKAVMRDIGEMLANGISLLFEIGVEAIKGFAEGLKKGFPAIFKTLDKFFGDAETYVKEKGIGFSEVMTGAMISGILLSLGMVLKLISNVTKVMGAVEDVLDSTAGLIDQTKKLVKGVNRVLGGVALEMISKSLINFSIAVAILTASIWTLSTIDDDKLWPAVAAVGALVVIMGILMIALTVLSKQMLNAKDLDSIKANAVAIAQLRGLFMAMSLSILFIAAAMKLLSGVDDKGIYAGIAIAVLLIGGITGLIAAIKLLPKSKIQTAAIDDITDLIRQICFSLLMVAIFIRMLAPLKPGDIAKGGIVAALLLGAVGGIFAAVRLLPKGSKIQAGAIRDVGSLIRSVAVSLLIMGIAIRTIGKMSWPEIAKGLLVATLLLGAAGGLMAATHLLTKNKTQASAITGVGGMVLKICAGLLLMAFAMKMLGGMEWKELGKAGLVAILFIGAVGGLMAATNLLTKEEMPNKNVSKVGTMVLGVAAGLLLMSGAFTILGKLSWPEIGKGAAVAGGLIIAVMGLMLATKLLTTNEISAKSISKVGIMILEISAALLIMSAVIAILAHLDPEKAWPAVGMISILLTLIGGLMLITKWAQGSKEMMQVIISLIGMIAVLALSIGLLTLVDTKKLVGAAAALGTLLLVMTTLMYATSLMKTGKGTIKVLMTLTGIIVVLAGVIALLSFIDCTNALPNAAALVLLMATLTGVAVVLSKFGTRAKSMMNASKSIIILAGIMVALGLVLGLMSAMGAENALPNALALSVLLGTMTGVLIILGILGKFVGKATAGLIALGVLTLIVGVLAFILVKLNECEIGNAMNIAMGLCTLLVTMSGILAILTIIGLGGHAAFVGLGALAVLIVGLGALLVGLGALVDTFPEVETFLDKGIPILEKIGHALGSFFGNIVSGFVDGALAGLPAIGTHLSNFMTEAQGFIDGASAIKPEMLAGVKALAQTILILTAADLLDSLTSWLTGGSSLADFGAQLPALGMYINAFATSLGSFGDDQINSISCAAKAIKLMAEAASELPNEGGVAGWFMGENDMLTFGAKLPTMALYLNAFISNLGVFGEDQIKTVDCAARAIKAMADSASALPNSGGVAGWFMGENDMLTFGADLPSVALFLNGFITNLGVFGEDQIKTAKCAALAIKEMATAASELPNEGGLVSLFTGDNNLISFSSDLPAIALCLAGFVANLGVFSDAQVATATCAANAIAQMAKAAAGLPNEGGLAALFTGDNDLSKFAGKLPGVAENLKGFISNLGTFDESAIATTEVAVKVISSIAKLSKTDLESTIDNLGSFGGKIVTFAGKLKEFMSELSGLDATTMDAAITSIDKLLDVIKRIESANAGAVEQFNKSLDKISKDSITNFISAFDGAADQVKAAGARLLANVVIGVTENSDQLPTAMTNAATNGANSVNATYPSYYSAGVYIISGMMAGLDSKAGDLYAKIDAIAANAEEKMRNALKINSPSKVFMAIGTSVPEGFAMGIDKMSRMVDNSAVGMGDVAMDGLSDSISRIATIVDQDIDSQPTIRPVLDLSDVRYGLGEMNNMFGSNPNVDVLARVGSISSSMNRMNQNGANDDIISAIDKLNDNIGNLEHASYTINGITYADGSDVAEAIQTIIRAARIERRV